ncbi:MAG: DUF4214 domain-containing protein [Acidobacteriota bacterium]
MRKATSILCALSISLTLCLGGFTATAQKPAKAKDKTKPFVLPRGILKNWDKIPARVKQALTPQARDTWESFTPTQQRNVRARVFEIIRDQVAKSAPATQTAKSRSGAPTNGARTEAATGDSKLSFVDRLGYHRTIVGTSLMPASRMDSRQRKLVDKVRPPVWETGWATEKPELKANTTKLNHSRGVTKVAPLVPVSPQAGCTRGPEQFVRTFFEASLARPPHADELSYWMSTFTQAQSQATLLTAAQNLGYTLFGSQEYANRGRSNSDFVRDCYLAFLKREPEPEPGGWSFWTNQADQHGQAAVVPGFGLSTEFNDRVSEICSVATFDGDHDGLPDNLENTVADNFTPYYHVSQYETDNYSTFLDSIPQTVKARFGQTPVSHFRVVPLSGGIGPIRYNYVAGRWESFLRVDYWTMWDHDSGLVGESCNFAPGEQLLEGLKSHDIDDERSALLVSAPAVWTDNGFAVNLDPGAYSSLSLYTAAHESTPTAHNQYINFPQNPRPAGDRLELWQSLSKHGTYAFNPDGVVLLQQWQIAWIFDIVYQLFQGVICNGNDDWDMFWIEMFGDPAFGWGCETWTGIYVAVVYYVTILVYACATESFYEQGSQLANIRINLGEPQVNGFPGNPINGSSFIQEDDSHTGHLFSKLVQPLEFESLF